MEDREFLIWLYKRLEVVHHEPSHADYMCKLRAMIRSTPKEKLTPNTANGLKATIMERAEEFCELLDCAGNPPTQVIITERDGVEVKIEVRRIK